MSNEFVSSLSASVNAGAMILNDYLLQVSDVEGGHRLTITRGSEVQTMDVMDGEGGGGSFAAQMQADWRQENASMPDYVKNRTHYGAYMGDTITWNGNADGRDTVELPLNSDDGTMMIPFCRVAGNPPTADQLRSGDIAVTLSDGTIFTTANGLQDITVVMADGFAMIASLHILVVPYNNYCLVDGENVITFSRRGVYMSVMDGVYACSMRIAGFEFGAVKQLDYKYISGYALKYSNRVQWDGTMGDRDVVMLMPGAPQFFVKVSDAAPQLEAMQQSALEISFYSAEAGMQTESIPADGVAEYVFPVSDSVYVVGEYFAVVALQDNASFALGTITVNLPCKGMYFMCVGDEATGAMVGYVAEISSPAIQHGAGAVLMENCLPESIQRVGGDVILHSCTEGSSKRFMLQVNDGGELSAIEVG